MTYIVNRSLMLDQAVLQETRRHIETLRLGEWYPNNAIYATLVHPFMAFFREEGARAADHFPAIYITSGGDVKDVDLMGVTPPSGGERVIGFSRADIEALALEAEGGGDAGIHTTLGRGGGYEELWEAYKKGTDYVYGMTRRFYRKETVKFEVWAENIQIKNELYEAARLYALGAFRDDMARDYRCFDPKVEDGSVRGERLEAYNVDFGVVLACGSVSFDCTYCVEQSIIDTDIAYKDVEYIIRKSASLKREGKAQ